MLKSALLIEKKLNREEYLQKEGECKRLHRSKLKVDPKAYKESLKKDRQRKKVKATTPAQFTATLPQDMEMTPNQGQTVTPNQARSDSNSTTPPFSNKASLHRSMNKARQALPKSPRKKTKVIQCLIHNLSPSSRGNLSKMMRWQPEPSSKGCHPSLSDKKKEFLLAFLKSEGMSYTMPGRKDQVYVGKDENGKRMYKAKHYLLWTLREILSMLNRELCSENSFKTKFNETLTFSTLYRLFKENKEIYYQHEIPQLSCLCEKRENFELLCEWIKISETSFKLLPTSVRALLPKFCCNYRNEACALETCRNCPEFDMSPLKSVDEVHFYQWSKQATKKYPEKSLHTESGQEVLEIFRTQLSIVKKRLFLARTHTSATKLPKRT